MKSIEFDPQDYEIIDTIDYGEDQFQKVKFKTGYYGIVYVTTDKDTRYYDVIFIGTDKNSDIYTDVFLEFARSQTEIINKIHEKVDNVTLMIQLNDKESTIFKEVITKDEANDLIERLKISNEIMELQKQNNTHNNKTTMILNGILIICILINLVSALNNTGWLIK